jgi:uncharacterized protein (TIGR03790 family)
MIDRQLREILLLTGMLIGLFGTGLAFAEGEPQILLPANSLLADDLAVIVNGSDPLSIKVAQYYQSKRGIDRKNVIYINFDPGKKTISPGDFAVLKRTVESKLPPNIQAYLLTWAAPYRVGCMSISSAFAFGYDVKYCAKGCKTTYPSPYYNSESRQPYTDFGMRPTMLLAADNFDDAKALIDRGVAADGSMPDGTAFLLETRDKNRSVRKIFFPSIKSLLGDQIRIKILQAEAIKDQPDVMFYFTGQKWVNELNGNDYLPGAVADHLTSTGGVLSGGSQMSAMDWLKAGVTGSYGTVVEPCNFTQKFPNPLVMMERYLAGETLIEAYWKSVKMPGQGIFIGDPLASPYDG